MDPISAILAIGNVLVPPVVDFVKKKFIPSENDTPERTMGTLATSKPEVLPAYITAITGHIKAKVEYFNRDVIGQASQWVVDLRAAIRPIAVLVSFLLLGLEGAKILVLEDGARYACVTVTSNWIGSRLTKK